MIRNKDIAKIWVYNAGIDRTWQDKAYGVRKVNDLNEQIMFNKQGEIVLFLTGPDDIVFLTEKPDKEFLEDIKKLDNMWFQSRLYGVEKHLAKERIDSLISSFGLKNYLQYPVLSYSGGIKRRLDIAMNMVSMPKILFLDEPTVGMDVESRKMLWDMIRKIKTQYGTTIFLTTHYLEEADQLSDTICIMKNGKEIIQGPPQSLKAYTNQNIVKIRFNDENTCKKTFAFFKSKNLGIYKREKFEIYLKVNEKVKEFQKINKILLEENIVFSAVEIVEPSLEDVFLSMIETSKEGALL